MVFVGRMALSPGLSAPVLGSPATGSWTLSNAGALPNAGVGSTSEGSLGAALVSLAGAFHAGSVDVFGGAHCFLFAGSNGSGSVDVGGEPIGIDNFFWRQSAAAVLVAHGDTDRGEIDMVMFVLPSDADSGSCVARIESHFTVFGVAAFTY